MEKYDFVVPFVDNNDKLWQRIYREYCERYKLHNKIIEMRTDRYQDNVKLINYQLKLVNKYMPFINKIYLLLMNVEQANGLELPSNVEIVYHAKFIPQKYLPTFNSTTIEMFLWNIPNLSEKFIYANDDMLPFKPLKESDFFKGDKVKIEWWKENINEFYNMFRQQCFNSYKHLAYRLHIPTEQGIYLRPAHSFTPMIKSHCKQAYDLLNDVINRHIRAFRTEYQYNQYIYPIFEHFVYGTCDSNIDFLYTQLQDNIDLDHDIVCVNIVPQEKEKELVKEIEKYL